MILILSHDPEVLRAATKSLTSLRGSVVECADPNEAMDFSSDHEPEVIVADMSLPEFSGAAFSTAYRERFPERDTLFIFLFESGAQGQISSQIENPGDDFVVKPIEPSSFQTRVNLLFRRSRMGTRARFRGDLETMPLVEVIQFCERTALTGRVCVSTEDGPVQIPFNAGTMDDEDGSVSDKLGDLLDLKKARFVIESAPVSFDEIEKARHGSVLPSSSNSQHVPIARTSALLFGKRELTLRTEYAPETANRVTTTVTLDDNLLREYSADVEPDATGQRSWKYVNEYHAIVEDRVRTTIDQFFRGDEGAEQTGKFRILPSAAIKMARPSPPESTPADTAKLRASLPPYMGFGDSVSVPEVRIAREPLAPGPIESPAESQIEPLPALKTGLGRRSLGEPGEKDALFDEAIRRWRQQELAVAIELMEKAELLDPDDPSLQVCLRVLRRRMQTG